MNILMKLLPLRKSLMHGWLTPAGIALLYAVLAALWIVVSGYLLTISVADPVLMGRIELARTLVIITNTSPCSTCCSGCGVRRAYRMPGASWLAVGGCC